MSLWCRLALIGLLEASVEVAAMEVAPIGFTPQGDAVNDKVRMACVAVVY